MMNPKFSVDSTWLKGYHDGLNEEPITAISSEYMKGYEAGVKDLVNYQYENCGLKG